MMSRATSLFSFCVKVVPYVDIHTYITRKMAMVTSSIVHLHMLKAVLANGIVEEGG